MLLDVVVVSLARETRDRASHEAEQGLPGSRRSSLQADGTRDHRLHPLIWLTCQRSIGGAAQTAACYFALETLEPLCDRPSVTAAPSEIGWGEILWHPTAVGLEVLELTEIGRRVRRVREEVGVSREELADALAVAPADVDRIEEGSLDQLPGDYVLTIAKILKVDFRYFISKALDAEEASVRKVYRALAAPTAEDKLAIRRFINFAIAQREVEALLAQGRGGAPPIIGRIQGGRHKDQGVNAARRERERLGLGDGPVGDVFDLIRSTGVLLFRHELRDSNLSGLTVVHERGGVSVMVNFVDDLYRQFFSAAHEYGHVLLDRGALQSDGCIVSYKYTGEQLVEMRANSFAGEFLLPTSALTRFESSRASMTRDDLILRIAREYRVNTQAVVVKMGDVGWLDSEAVNSFLQKPSVRVPKAEKVDPEIPNTLTERQKERRLHAIKRGMSGSFLEAIRRALVGREISWGRAAELLDLDRQDSQSFMVSVGAAV